MLVQRLADEQSVAALKIRLYLTSEQTLAWRQDCM